MRRLIAALIPLLAACPAADPVESPDAPPRPDARALDASPGPDAPMVDANPGCIPLGTDYRPRDNGSADDTWPVCISDDNAYHPFNPSISTIARVAAFEAIADLLFTGSAPSNQDFLDARVQYNLSNGLASRVQRREDEHYPPVLDGGGAPIACQSLTPAEQQAHPERCVGSAVIGPLLEAAFTAGQTGSSSARTRRLAAARIEGALLWFLYLSVHKEATTCTGVPADCDSSYAYYSGGDERATGKGFARYVRALDVETHDRIWDGELAVRCWRDLDNPSGVATDLVMRDLAIAQLDRAALRGVALIVRDKAVAMDAASGDARLALWDLLRVLGPVLDREAELRDPTSAAALRSQLALTEPGAVDVDVILAALDAIFPCP